MLSFPQEAMERMNVYGESLETSVGWSNLRKLIQKLRVTFDTEIQTRQLNLLTSKLAFRISQVYLDGVCFYLYFCVSNDDETTAMRHLFELKSIVMKIYLECGASISHHHGVGKRNKEKYLEIAANNGVELGVLRAVKDKLDPKNIFANGNSYTHTETRYDAYDVLKHKL